MNLLRIENPIRLSNIKFLICNDDVVGGTPTTAVVGSFLRKRTHEKINRKIMLKLEAHEEEYS